MQRKYGTELLETSYPISFHKGPDTWMVPFCWQPDGRGNENLIEIGNRNANITTAVENANFLQEKYAICTLC